MGLNEIGNVAKSIGTNIVNNGIVKPITDIAVRETSNILASGIESAIRSIKGLFQRCITFQIGLYYGDNWKELALYSILERWNNISQSRDLVMDMDENGNVTYRLKDGIHNLKYRNYDIMVYIETEQINKGSKGRPYYTRDYSIITYNLSPQFVKDFEVDMLRNRNEMFKINKNSPYTDIYEDVYDGGYVYWYKRESVPKRKMNTIYIPKDKKLTLINTINSFFAKKKFYRENGIPHNLKILLHGPAGPQPLDEPIVTPYGIKQFGDLKVGDYVYNRLAQPVMVSEIYEIEEELDTYEVILGGYRSTRCAGTHKWPTVKYKTDNEYGLEEIDTLHVMDNINNGRIMVLPDHLIPRSMIKKCGMDEIMASPISEVKPLGYKSKMRCIHIDDPEHIYLAGNSCIPTCNSGKDSIARTIAAEWNRNLYYVTGDGNGKHIPASIISTSKSLNNPLMLISDIDKYPYLINEASYKNSIPEEESSSNFSNEVIITEYKDIFNKMINALDGILSGNDKIIIMTTNHIDKFSKTFLRPGRIDLSMEIGYVTPEVFRDYVYHFYKKELPEDIKLKDKRLTISKLQGDVVFMEMPYDILIDKYVK